MKFIGVYPDSFSLARILVADDKLRFADFFFNCKNGPEITAAFAALKAFKSQNCPPACLFLWKTLSMEYWLAFINNKPRLT